MNERIIELAIKAREYAESKPAIYQVAYDKKFAELIVKECIDIAYREGDNVAYLALHFGVEE